MDYQFISGSDNATIITKNQIAQFLDDHLDEYGDNILAIYKCLDYALSKYPHQGGFAVLAKERDELLGALVMCKTGMEGFIPENLLVYIAVHRNYRGEGIGRTLIDKSLTFAKGDIALHVHPDNPAVKLYESVGFQQKYTEMRLLRQRTFYGLSI